MRVLSLTSVLIAFPALAQTSYPPGATSADIEALNALIPKPASSVPPTEMVGGSVGTAGTYRPADAANARITRSGVFTVTGSTGTITGTWAMPLPANAASYPMFFTGIGPSGTLTIDCVVSVSTNTGFTAQCRQNVLNLGLLSSPLSILAPAGTQVYALALPSTQ